MANIRFEWDESKNQSNLRKHGVKFNDASRIFDDPLRLSDIDRVINGEERWLTIGLIQGLILLAVAHTVREEWGESNEGGPVEIIRIISARRATPKERRGYGEDRSIHP